MPIGDLENIRQKNTSTYQGHSLDAIEEQKSNIVKNYINDYLSERLSRGAGTALYENSSMSAIAHLMDQGGMELADHTTIKAGQDKAMMDQYNRILGGKIKNPETMYKRLDRLENSVKEFQKSEEYINLITEASKILPDGDFAERELKARELLVERNPEKAAQMNKYEEMMVEKKRIIDMGSEQTQKLVKNIEDYIINQAKKVKVEAYTTASSEAAEKHINTKMKKQLINEEKKLAQADKRLKTLEANGKAKPSTINRARDKYNKLKNNLDALNKNMADPDFLAQSREELLNSPERKTIENGKYAQTTEEFEKKVNAEK
ncbi:hypothetical protein Zmor_022101 [Zophobas morio]|uniref:Uncharacterized protein n=1 Tax=Zophobas morio TaxID=2755281 RepID=A0AA38M0M7_9CUCU|nr:hypothetical protein Zmor_022101 [Zophobas morio]